jgi:hypothetical protein
MAREPFTPYRTWRDHSWLKRRGQQPKIELDEGEIHTSLFPLSLDGNRQASRRMLTCVITLSSSVHWFCGTNRQTLSHLVLRPNPKNRCNDFETQITKPSTLVLRPKLRNRHSGFDDKPLTNRCHRF